MQSWIAWSMPMPVSANSTTRLSSQAGAAWPPHSVVAGAGRIACADREFTAPRGEASRIADQVPDDLHQPCLVARDVMVAGDEIENDLESRD